MSATTWKNEFYRVGAKSPTLKTKIQKIEHSLTKWIGIRDKNLKKHGLSKNEYGEIVEDGKEVIVMGGASCALCVTFYDAHTGCPKCPLTKVRGGKSCDKEKDNEEQSPWRAWSEDEDLKPMIKLLRKALKAETVKKSERLKT